MYSVVLMMAMTGGADVPAGLFHRGGGCCGGGSACSGYGGGCYGGGYGCTGGSSCTGGKHHGRRGGGHHKRGHGCCGGGYGCSGYGGYGYGCTGGYGMGAAYGCTGGYGAGAGYGCTGSWGGAGYGCTGGYGMGAGYGCTGGYGAGAGYGCTGSWGGAGYGMGAGYGCTGGVGGVGGVIGGTTGGVIGGTTNGGTTNGGTTNGGTTKTPKGWSEDDVNKLRDAASKAKLSDEDLDRDITDAKAAGVTAQDLTDVIDAGVKGKQKPADIQKNIQKMISDAKKAGGETRQSAPARILVNLPADAQLLIDDAPTAQTSSRRLFVSPPLAAGTEFHYTLTAKMVRDGKPVSVTKKVAVRAGEETRVEMNEASPVNVAQR